MPIYITKLGPKFASTLFAKVIQTPEEEIAKSESTNFDYSGLTNKNSNMCKRRKSNIQKLIFKSILVHKLKITGIKY